MRSIHYADGVIVTGDDIADAVIVYAEALARSSRADTIDIPVRMPSGEVGRSQILVGPASQLVIVPSPAGVDEIVDAEIVRELHAKAERLNQPSPVSEHRDDTDTIDLDFED